MHTQCNNCNHQKCGCSCHFDNYSNTHDIKNQCTNSMCKVHEHHDYMCNSHQCLSQIDKTMFMWRFAFKHALHEMYVDAIKAKLQKKWAKKFDQVADAVVDIMENHWQTNMQEVCHHDNVKDQLSKVIMEHLKK